MARGRRLAVTAVAGAVLLAGCGDVIRLTPPPLELVEQPQAVPSVILDADGGVLATLRREYRERVDIDDVPQRLIDAVLAAEDSRFFIHDGLDARALARAAARNVAAGEVVEGGSTISQQLVELRFLPPTEDTLATKLVEAALARRLEDEYSKQWILEEYLNTVYLGGGAHGVGAAAWSYFRKDVADLDLGQAALLAGLIRTPGAADPRVDIVAARSRRDTVLDAMVATGVLPQVEAAEAQQQPVVVREAPRQPVRREPHIVDLVVRTLLSDPALGPDESTRWQRLTDGGLTIRTTLDPAVQASARLALAEHLDDAGDPDGAVVTLDTRTGAILAAVGSIAYETLQFDLATQGVRQPGSVFKGVTLAAALADGYEGDSIIDARGGRMPTGGVPWTVRGSGARTTTLAAAIRRSDNGAFARLGLEIGVDRVAATAAALGVTSPLDDAPAMLLGGTSACCTVLEMATVYATLAALGTHHHPTPIAGVTAADGTVVIGPPQVGDLVLDEVFAYDAVTLLQGVVTSGTGRAAAVEGHSIAGKTGTSTDNADGWFVGATPSLTTAVWVGHHDARRAARVDGRAVQGGTTPAQVFAQHMAALLGDRPDEPFVLPEHRLVTVEVDVATGLLAAPWCPDTEVVVLPDRRAPTATCPSPAPSPAPAPTPAPTPAPSPSPTVLAPAPEPSPTGPPPSPAPSPDPTPSPTPSPSASESVEPTPAPSATPAAEPDDGAGA